MAILGLFGANLFLQAKLTVRLSRRQGPVQKLFVCLFVCLWLFGANLRLFGANLALVHQN